MTIALRRLAVIVAALALLAGMGAGRALAQEAPPIDLEDLQNEVDQLRDDLDDITELPPDLLEGLGDLSDTDAGAPPDTSDAPPDLPPGILAELEEALEASMLDSELAGIAWTPDGTQVNLAMVVPGAPAGEIPTVEVEADTELVAASVQSLDTAPTVVLVVDTSGSMQGERLDAAKDAAATCIAEMPALAEVGMVAYAEGPPLIVEPSPDRAALLETVAELTAVGETATFDAVLAATDTLANTSGSIDDRASRFLVLLSDGEDTVSQSTADDAVAALTAAGFQLFALGIQPEGDAFPTLEALTGSTGGTLVLGGAEDLAPLCGTVAEHIDGRYGVSLTFGEAPSSAINVGLGFGSGQAAVDVPAGGGSGSGSGEGKNEGGGPQQQAGDEGGDSGDDGMGVGAASGGDDAGADIDTGGGAGTDIALPEVPDIPLNGDDLNSRVAPTPTAEVELRLWAGAAATVASPLLLVMLLAPSKRMRHGLRIRRVAGPSGLHRVSGLVGRLLERNRASRAVELRLERAAVSMRAGEYVTFTSIATAIVALTLLVAGLRVSALIAVPVIPTLSWLWLRRRGRSRSAAFQNQLGDTLLILAGALRSGNSTMQALAAAADKAPSPNAEEFQRVVAEARIGRDVVMALRDMADRMESEDAAWVVEAIALNRELGGNLASTLDNVAETLQARAQIQSQVKVMSAEGRLTATILLALPLVVAVILQFLNPGYLGSLFTSGTGNIILGLAIGLMVVGAFWVSRLVKLEY